MQNNGVDYILEVVHGVMSWRKLQIDRYAKMDNQYLLGFYLQVFGIIMRNVRNNMKN